MKINSHNEWDPLREVILGTVEDMTTCLEFPESSRPSEAVFEKAMKIAEKARPEWYVNEVREDLDGFAKILTDFGAKVFRPSPYGAEKLFCTPDWCASGKDIYNMRDLHMVVGDMVIVGPSPVRSRYFEPNSLYDIWYQYFEEGFKWITAPKPKLLGTYVIPYYRDGEEIITEEDMMHRELGGTAEKYEKLSEDEILFDAACTVRLGKDLLFLVSSTGNYKGVKWLQSILGDEYRVHTTTSYRSSHIDSTILPLRPGLVLLNSARVNPENCPEIFKNWEKIYFKDVEPIPEQEVEFQKNVRDKAHHELTELGIESDLHHMSSPWSSLNIFSLDQQTVVVQDTQKKLIKELENHKLTVIPASARHSYTMLGGLHCSTLDTVRESKLENYFD